MFADIQNDRINRAAQSLLDSMRALQQSLTSVELERPTHPLRKLVLRLLAHERSGLLERARQLKATQTAWHGKVVSETAVSLDPTNFLFTLERHVQSGDAAESTAARSLTAIKRRFLAAATVSAAGTLHVALLDSTLGEESEIEFPLPWADGDSMDAKRHQTRRVVGRHIDIVVLGNAASTTEADGR